MLSGELCSDTRGKEGNFNAMAVASVRKPEFTSRVDSALDLAMKHEISRQAPAQRRRATASNHRSTLA
jgi:hypothetical protein